MESKTYQSSFENQQKQEKSQIDKLNMSQLYYENNTSGQQEKRQAQKEDDEQSQQLNTSWRDQQDDDGKQGKTKSKSKPQMGQQKSEIKVSIKEIEEDDKKTISRNDIVMSAVSFSKFQAISDPSQQQESQYLKSPSNKVENIKLNSRQVIKRIPTSAKIISSKKIVDDPVEILPYAGGAFQTVTTRKINLKIQQNFEYRLISKTEMAKRFFDFCASKGMQVKDNDDVIVATKKVPFYKIAIKLCFPTSDVDPEIYELDYSTDNKASINKLSGDENKFEAFKEEFLVGLWIPKYLQARSPQQNIRYFMKFCNSPLNQTKLSSLPLRTCQQIDSIKQNIEQAISQAVQGVKSVGRWSDETFNTENLIKIRKDLKHIEDRLVNLYESEMAKQRTIIGSIGNENVLRITPAVEKALISQFYTCIQLDEIVKKLVITEKTFGDFEKKKMIIKGSLSSLDICKYLEIEDTYKSCIDASQSNEIMKEATKILASLSYSNYPSPPQIIECVSLFKQSLQKDMRGLWQGKSNSKVKFTDDTNGDRTMLQLFIYCLIKCSNREIYPTIQVASIFNNTGDDSVQALGVDALATVAMLKKAIFFIQNEWQL